MGSDPCFSGPSRATSPGLLNNPLECFFLVWLFLGSMNCCDTPIEDSITGNLDVWRDCADGSFVRDEQ